MEIESREERSISVISACLSCPTILNHLTALSRVHGSIGSRWDLSVRDGPLAWILAFQLQDISDPPQPAYQFSRVPWTLGHAPLHLPYL